MIEAPTNEKDISHVSRLLVSCFLLHMCQVYAGGTKYNNLMPKKVFKLKNEMVFH